MLKSHLVLCAALVSFGATSALGDGHEAECAMGYEVFEASVPHTDMADCPASMNAGDDAFCRVAVVAEVATVFVFSYDTSCLIKTQSFEDDEFTFVIE